MSEEPRRCRRCRSLLDETARFCSRCGARVSAASREMPLLKVLWGVGLAVAVILLGGLGACFIGTGVTMFAAEGANPILGLLMLLVAAAAFVGIAKIVKREG